LRKQEEYWYSYWNFIEKQKLQRARQQEHAKGSRNEKRKGRRSSFVRLLSNKAVSLSLSLSFF
jgi:hypothetical protein